MSYSKSIAILFVAVLCTSAAPADAGQRGSGRSPTSGRGTVGHAVPRTPSSGRVAPRGDGPRGGYRASLRSYYYPYYYGYRPGLSIGLGLYGYPYYGYYGYPYGAYGYSYGGYDPYGYGGYGYGGYGYGGYVAPRGYAAYEGGVRIQGAPRNAQVFVDGYYAGIVNDFDGTFQRLDLEPGPHEVEIRVAGAPPLTYDVNVTPGQTLTIHANIR